VIVGPDDASNRRVLEAVETELRQNRLGLSLVLADGVTGLPVDVRVRSGFQETVDRIGTRAAMGRHDRRSRMHSMTTKPNRAARWLRENAATLVLISTVAGGIWILRGSIVTTDDLRNLATQADLAPLARRADVATDREVVNTLRETVASLATSVERLDATVDRIAERTNATVVALEDTVNQTTATVIVLQDTVDELRGSVERTNSTVLALAATVARTSETVDRLSETVGTLRATGDRAIPLLVSCMIDLHFWNPEAAGGEQPALPESCEQARRQ
jgi:uncharacterized protein YlxW (UPF0749 family)